MDLPKELSNRVGSSEVDREYFSYQRNYVAADLLPIDKEGHYKNDVNLVRLWRDTSVRD